MGAVFNPEQIDVVILCGGLGKRLHSVVNDKPKPMVVIHHRPFLDILIEYVAGYGFKRFILCIGYMGEVIKDHYEKKSMPLTILFSSEKELLGTGGAIKNAEPLIQSSPFLVMNGDSFCQVELDRFIDFHFSKGGWVTIALARIEDTTDYGLVTMEPSGQIVKFDEKIKVNMKNNNLINAGLYLIEKKSLALIPSNKIYSLEYDLFPEITDGRIYGYVADGDLIDIGTPQRYEKAKQILNRR